MNVESACLEQKAVYYERVSYDRKGEPIVDVPVEIDVRWELNTAASSNREEAPVSTPLTLFTDRSLVVGSRVWLGELDDLPNEPSPLYQIESLKSIPDIKGDETQYTATLMRV